MFGLEIVAASPFDVVEVFSLRGIAAVGSAFGLFAVWMMTKHFGKGDISKTVQILIAAAVFGWLAFDTVGQQFLTNSVEDGAKSIESEAEGLDTDE